MKDKNKNKGEKRGQYTKCPQGMKSKRKNREERQR